MDYCKCLVTGHFGRPMLALSRGKCFTAKVVEQWCHASSIMEVGGEA